jgi:hypothetical protein
MSILAIEIERAKQSGDQQIADWSGAQRSVDNIFIEDGDEFVIPADAPIFEQKIGTGKAQYTFVEVNGQAKKFYPSCLNKSRRSYDEDGKIVNAPAVVAHGTANEEFRKYATVKEGMEALKGKKLKVTSMFQVRTLRPGTTQLMTTGIPQIDFVVEAEPAPAAN